MPDPTPQEIASRYTRRAFSVLRVAAGLSVIAARDVARLGRDLERLIVGAGVGDLGRRDLSALLREIDERIAATFASIATTQGAAIRELLEIEAGWASRVIADGTPGESMIERLQRSLLVLGAKPDEQWGRQGEALARRLADAVREAHAVPGQADVLRQTVGEILSTAQRDAQALADVSSTSAAAQGHAEVARSEGAVAFQWHAVLDSRVTAGCALRHGLLYTLEYEPLGHSVPIERPPPRHWGCRSLLLPMLRLPKPGDRDYGSFESFIGGLSKDEQDDILGEGRADLYRRGVITKADLVNQRGRVLTLRELRGRRD